MANSAIKTALPPVTAEEQSSAPPCASAKNPVDLVHLSRQSLGGCVKLAGGGGPFNLGE